MSACSAKCSKSAQNVIKSLKEERKVEKILQICEPNLKPANVAQSLSLVQKHINIVNIEKCCIQLDEYYFNAKCKLTSCKEGPPERGRPPQAAGTTCDTQL